MAYDESYPAAEGATFRERIMGKQREHRQDVEIGTSDPTDPIDRASRALVDARAQLTRANVAELVAAATRHRTEAEVYRRALEAAVEALELALTVDPDMPSAASDVEHCEAALMRACAALGMRS